MKRNQLMALSLISAAAALGIGGAAATLKTDLPAEARSALVTLAASTDWHGPYRRHGGSHGDLERRTERLIAFAEEAFQFEGNQRAAWQELAKRLRAATVTIGEARDNAHAEGMGAKERLAQAENMMAAGLAALRSLRPAFDTFYGTLTPAQRKTLDAFAARHHHSREM